MAEAPPQWLALLPIKDGEEFHFIMRRNLTTSDLNNNRNRLNISAGAARANLYRLLRSHERAGTNVVLYPSNRWFFPAQLTIYDVTSQTVILGEQYRILSILSDFNVGDDIRAWAFRNRADTLCFAIEKIVAAAV